MQGRGGGKLLSARGSIHSCRNRLALSGVYPLPQEEVTMAEFREDDITVHRRSGGAGRILLIVAVILALIVAVLFATGFWTADIKDGALPKVSVQGGDMPAVDVDSKAVVVGSKPETVNVPTVGTKEETIDV